MKVLPRNALDYYRSGADQGPILQSSISAENISDKYLFSNFRQSST
jgi:hypothetical protein